jgi:hypothetical protein
LALVWPTPKTRQAGMICNTYHLHFSPRIIPSCFRIIPTWSFCIPLWYQFSAPFLKRKCYYLWCHRFLSWPISHCRRVSHSMYKVVMTLSHHSRAFASAAPSSSSVKELTSSASLGGGSASPAWRLKQSRTGGNNGAPPVLGTVWKAKMTCKSCGSLQVLRENQKVLEVT